MTKKHKTPDYKIERKLVHGQMFDVKVYECGHSYDINELNNMFNKPVRQLPGDTSQDELLADLIDAFDISTED